MHPEDARSLGIVDGDDVALQTPFQRIQGRASLTGRLRGVVGTTALFGELAVDLDASTDPDPMLRVPGLDVAPARVTRTSDG
jgi:anaerobic selenocysteine-containing dehydrogenase